MSQRLAHLFSPIELGPVRLKNRIVSTGHHSYLADEFPGEALIAYHEARARGGAGLIVTEVIAVHPTARFSSALLMALDERCVAPFAELARRVRRHGCRVFAQLFHPGREILSSGSGMLPVALAPSAVPNERFHIMPRPLGEAQIGEIVAGYGRAAGHLAEAGYDGVEIVASHGYLPAQFLNPQTNLRDDHWGGDFQRRLNFLRASIAAIRAAAPGLALGLRISADELDDIGLDGETVARICAALSDGLDYFSVVAGSSASLGASTHITPSMGEAAGYIAPYAAVVRRACGKPVIATGRINQPQLAERIIAAGEADLCGMTRALIADPQMAEKAAEGRFDEIRACIACNQSCIGRAHRGFGISCIQNPVSGRELEFADAPAAARAKDVIVVGGGPAGMKAALSAAERGHRVRLYEAGGQLGGQVLLAQRLPAREEFGGLIGNLQGELARAGVEIIRGRRLDAPALRELSPDAAIIATGARPYRPQFEGSELAQVVDAWALLDGGAQIGRRVLVADWRADWIGLGLAERLAREGHAVQLCSNAALAGESLPLYVRNHYVARLLRLGVSIHCHARLFGWDGETVYCQHTLSREPMLFEGIDTLLLALGHVSENDMLDELAGAPFEVVAVGDCLAPRSAEEAIYEGFIAGRSL